MAEDDRSLLNLINASGFLFQIRVEDEIDRRSGNSNWIPIAREHRWVDPLDGKEGFIDLILESNISRMIIECKRVAAETAWVFLVPFGNSETQRSRLLWTYEGPMKSDTFRKKISEWHDFRINVSSRESSFCVVRGQGEKDTPMLERLSSLLLRSMEDVANQELNFQKSSNGDIHVYFPVIITNAKLYTSRFETNDINILSGQLAEAKFESVPLVRFRKNLSSSVLNPQFSDLKHANRNYERTVFIVNSAYVNDILEGMNLPYANNSPWPWEKLT